MVDEETEDVSPLALLSFVGHESATSRSVLLTDSIHHHLALATLITRAGFVCPISQERERSGSLHGQLAVACAVLGSSLFVVAHHIFWLPSAGFLHSSLPPCSALLAHHLWLASAFTVGSFVHLQLAGLDFHCFAFSQRQMPKAWTLRAGSIVVQESS